MLSKNTPSYAEIEKYRLPVYVKSHNTKYVYWYVLDPDSVQDGKPKLKRIRKKFNHYHTAKERDEAARRFCYEISIKLKNGWNPLIQNTANKGYTPIDEVFQRYERYLRKLQKDKAIKAKTLTDYLSRLKQLKMYNDTPSYSVAYIYQLDMPYIEGFLEYIYIDRNTTPRTRNNYLRWISSLCTYLTEKGFSAENQAAKISLLKEDDKRRQALKHTDMQKLTNYLEKNDPKFLLACQVHYYTLIRPNEMSYIRIQDISLQEQTIFVSKDISKNGRNAKVTVPKRLLLSMIDAGIFIHPGSHYLFGKGFEPSEKRADSRIFREAWARVREALHFPETYQFYSLKDTGISDTIDKVGLTIAKDQARHSSVATTNKYVRKEQLQAHPELKDYEGDL